MQSSLTRHLINLYYLKVHSFYFEHHSKKHEKSTSSNTVLPDFDSQSSLFGWMWFPVKNDDNDIDRLFLPLLFMSLWITVCDLFCCQISRHFSFLFFSFIKGGFIFLSFQFFFGIFFLLFLLLPLTLFIFVILFCCNKVEEKTVIEGKCNSFDNTLK